jgi:hypothetical protein
MVESEVYGEIIMWFACYEIWERFFLKEKLNWNFIKI